MIAESFYSPEHWGAWMRGSVGEIVFKTELLEGTAMMVYIRIKGAPWYNDCKTSIYLGDGRSVQVRSLSKSDIETNDLYRLSGAVGEGGVCQVSIVVEGELNPDGEESRNFTIGLCGIGYAQLSNIEARTNLLESFTFGAATVHD